MNHQSLSNFLFNHRSNNTPITHTRIGEKHLNIHGGSFSIHPDNLDEFYKAYYQHIFVEHNNEYLTEKQSGLCIAIDFDFRYAYEINERQHGDEEHSNLLQLVLDTLKNILKFEDGFKFKAFVMEKPNVNRLAEKTITKDGIHILINIQMEHALQEIMREDILPLMPTVLSHLPITNSWDSVFDETITKGTTNWQLYGSRKPDNEAYQLVSFKEIEYDINEDQFNITDYEASDFNLSADNFHELSVQNPNNPLLEMNPKVIMRYATKTQKTKPTKPTQNPKEQTIENSEEQTQSLHKLNYFVDNGFADEIASHKNHLDFTKIGYALNNDFDEAGLELYLKMAEKYSDDFTSKEDEYTKKYQTSLSKKKDNSIGTIYYIFKEYNLELYKELNIKYREEFPQYLNKETLEQLIDNSISSQTEYDIACVLAKKVNNSYVCVNIKEKKFYKFENHRWVEDTGYSLRNVISTGLHKLYVDKSSKLLDEISKIDTSNDDNAKTLEKLKRKHKSVQELCGKVKKTTDKNNIFREAMEILFDRDFIQKLDKTPYLFAFTNCVFDLRTGQQVQGRKDDYILTTAGYDYVDADTTDLKTELMELINTIHRNPNIRDYYLTILATGLCGLQLQKFIVATGTGGNGKSIINSLTLDCVGDYGYKLGASVLQTKIQTGANPELAGLHKKRFVLIQEPEQDKRLIASVLKVITGDKSINARQLYSTNTKTELNNTTLMECNKNPPIDETEDAIGRRLEAIPFKLQAKEQKDYDLLTAEELASGKYTLVNTYYITDAFREKYKQAFFEILLPYFKRFNDNNNQLGEPPIECATLTKDYLASNNDIFSWFELTFDAIPVEDLGTETDVPISLSLVYTKFSSSPMFNELSKIAKRAYNRKNFVNKIEENPFLRKALKLKNTKYNNIYLKADSIVGWKLKPEEDEGV
jgi:phage/plasmid-associated DNA primase